MEKGKKGSQFEDKIGLVLEELRRRHPAKVEIVRQLRLRLLDGRLIIPDFDLRYSLHHAEERFLIECQDRERSKPEIADKIRAAKMLSSRNKFIFVYSEEIPEPTRLALESGGVLVMKFNEFVGFIARVDMNLSAVEAQDPGEARKVLDAYSEWSPSSHDRSLVSEAEPPDWQDSIPPPPRD